jgi:hypothetical protein
LRGAQQTYALLEERAPASQTRAGDPDELAWRFYAGHGPANVRDLARWATLTLGQAESATEAVAVAPRRPAHELRLADAAAELAAFLGKQLELRLG